MDNLIDKILSMIDFYNNNSDYVKFIKNLGNDGIVIEKYYTNIDGACFDLSNSQYNYRVYVDCSDNGKYLLEIRKNLSYIYKTYGIHWEIFYSENNNRIVTVEERDKLRVCDEKDITCDELLLNYKKTIDELSNRLNLSGILEQIKDAITTYKRLDVKNLVIIKVGLVNASDYALTSDNDVVLLEDNDFALIITDYKGNIISFRGLIVDVDTGCGKMTFYKKMGTVLYKRVSKLYEPMELFFLYDYTCKEKYVNENIKFFDDTIEAQINVFTNNNDKKEKKYLIDYFKQYLINLKKDGQNIVNEMRYLDNLEKDGEYIKVVEGEEEFSFDRRNEKRIS